MSGEAQYVSRDESVMIVAGTLMSTNSLPFWPVLAGAVIGSIVFGHLTDRFGRRKFFFLSLSIYLAGVGFTALSWNLASFAIFLGPNCFC